MNRATKAPGAVTIERIVEDAARGAIAFPTSTLLAMRVVRAINDPECSLEAAARLIAAEPLLATKVVALSNSVAYKRSDRTTTDVRAAVAAIGLKMVQSLATSVAAHQLAGTAATNRQHIAARLWEHSAHVAALAFVIARRITRQPPETALFAGIVHELGGFYLLSRAREFPDLPDERVVQWLMPRRDTEPPAGLDDDRAEDLPEAKIGRAVLKALSVPEPVLVAVEALWKGYLTLPPETLGDTLMLADQLAPVRSPFYEPSGARPEVLRSNLDLVFGEETLLGILEESAAEVDSLTAVLRT